MRFSIGEKSDDTLEELAQDFGITEERPGWFRRRQRQLAV